MKLATYAIILLSYTTCIIQGDEYVDELVFDEESNDNSVISTNESKRSVEENNEYKYHAPQISNSVDTDDLMVAASPGLVTQDKPAYGNNGNNNDLMEMRDKRDAYPSFKQIHDFVFSSIPSPISNERRNELSAKATNPQKEKRHTESQKTKKKKSEVTGTKGQLTNIFSEIQSSKHHKLTRSDIRKLAKKAVILATLKKLDEVKTNTVKKSSVEKPKNNKTKKEEVKVEKIANREGKKTEKTNSKKSVKESTKKSIKESTKKSTKENAKKNTKENTKKSAKESTKKKNTVEDKKSLSVLGKDVKAQMKNDDVEKVLSDSKDTSQNNLSEFSEDISTGKKKSNLDNLSDEAMLDLETPGVKSKTATTPSSLASTSATTQSSLTSTSTTAKVEDDDDPFAIEKKTTIPKVATKMEDDIFSDADISDTNKDTYLDILNKKSEVPTKTQIEKITSLKSALGKANPSKVPGNFLPNMPSGLRMIAWKRLLEKKKKQLNELEASVGGVETASDKPVMINIDIDQDKIDKDAATLQDVQSRDSGIEKKDSTLLSNSPVTEDRLTSQHVHFLQKHIKGARSLRKLIAKTLIGHCKTTGKRILSAFVAMDKALARAQAIATVIGKKFNVDSERIDTLVGEKEDQVVETFLRDIFTKIN